jgi:hypothetical protein
MLRRWCGLVLTVLAMTGCATALQNTPQQDYVWAMWENCKPRLHLSSGMVVNRVEPDGRYWTNAVIGPGMADIPVLRACMQGEFKAHPYREWLAQNPGAPLSQEKLRPSAQPSGGTTNAPAPATAAPRTESVPAWTRGDEWSYRWSSPQGGGTYVWTVDREEVLDGTTFYVVKSGTARDIYYRKSDFAYYMDKVNGQVETRHTPPTSYFQWPLAAGAKVEVSYTRERPLDRQTEEISLTCESAPVESVTVAAGTFEAVKVTCRNRRTKAISFEMWLSPAVKHMVRERTYFSYGVRERELTGLKLR